ncbi:MAG TPA: NrfD/PsrC family molybdoenzyme membrane anchor subunit [Gemmataceae bacterium]|nr:NrfD/PsrC family molybdoenzyme membrane anchor subunit [Gemmataceae bacterium]
MNVFVADPQWGWWIILYFFLGGIAAGAYVAATLIDLAGSVRYREVARLGYWIAFPLICICGLLLTVDLERPERFWHMLFKSEIVREARAQGWPSTGASWKTISSAFMLKYWSPMSPGAWALLIFGACSFFSALGGLWSDGRLHRWFRRSAFAHMLQVVGAGVGLFVASYTGALATATNQPVWSDSNWIASLFLASAASTGLAMLSLIVHSRRSLEEEAGTGLTRAELWAVFLELCVFVAFLVSLGPLGTSAEPRPSLLRALLATTSGKIFLIGTGVLGILLPLFLLSPLGRVVRQRVVVAAVFALLGGFTARYGLLQTAPEILNAPADVRARYAVELGDHTPMPNWPTLPERFHFSPEDGRTPGGGRGADVNNRSSDFAPRSKVFDER